MRSAHSLATDDVVWDREEAADNERPPLVVVKELMRFLDEHGLGEGVPEIAPLGEGHSNVTLLVRRGGARFVLRRPPRPPIPPRAHDMGREVRVLRALAGRVRVPRVLAYCERPEVIGAPFFLMELVDGHVITSRLPDGFDSPAACARIGEELIESLVELHATDWRAVGLEGFGRPDGYLRRQVELFRKLWEHNRTQELPAIERIAEWLAGRLPESPAASVVHGDYRLGNLILAPEPPPRVAAIIDWEMATVGDPLADLGYLTALWQQADDPPRGGMFELTAISRRPGFPTRAELVELYEQRSGRSARDLRWYQVLALFKSAVFMEGNVKRARAGMSDDPLYASFGDGVKELAQRALELIGRG